MMGRLSAVVYTCFSMTQKRIGNSVDCFCFSFYSGLLVSSIGFFVLFCLGFGLGFFWGMSISSFSSMLFHFLFFLCLATVRVDMST